MNQPAPTKLFRAEGKTGAIECPACGAPITLRSFGALEQVACSYCGTVCKPEQDGSLEILERAERERRRSVLPLHQRGEIDGITWEIIGIAWREARGWGWDAAYPWQEFLLFNPYEGYRWLIYSMSDGVWSFGGALPGAPEQLAGGEQPVVRYAGEEYKHFTTAQATTTYVEGEFPWQVLVDDEAEAHDYVCPPKLISVETQHGEDGVDVNFTQLRPIEAAEVWAAFRLPGEPPPTTGIHPAALNPHRTNFYWQAGLVLLLVWLVALFGYLSGRAGEVVFQGRINEGEVLIHELEFGEPGTRRTLAFDLHAVNMNNSWVYAEALLVERETEEALALGIEAAYYRGVEDGESWSEGSPNARGVLGGVEGGKYLLQISTQFDTSVGRPDWIELTITHDAPLERYMFLPLVIIIAFPAFNWLRRTHFEGKRWANSDHAPEDDDD